MYNVLVTGGAGYVGSVLVRRLLNDGYKVICIDNLRYGGESLIGIWGHENFRFYKADITNEKDIDKILSGHDFHAIVHLAAIVGDPACQREPELAIKTNWDASVHLLNMSIVRGVTRFIFASTCSNYGRMADTNGYVDESSLLAPVSLYAELKVKFENLLLNDFSPNTNFCPTSLRFSTVYGVSPRMRFDLTVNEFTKELALGKELVVFGLQFWRPYCHVIDFSRAIMAVLKAPEEKVASNVFNVGNSKENYTKKMIVEELLKQMPESKIRYVEKNEDPRDYRVNFDKIRNELEFQISKTVPDGIKEIRDLLELGIINDSEEQKYYNIPHQQ